MRLRRFQQRVATVGVGVIGRAFVFAWGCTPDCVFAIGDFWLDWLMDVEALVRR